MVKVEEGKFYKTRDGRKVGPMMQAYKGNIASNGFVDKLRTITCQSWHDNGDWILGIKSSLDLIEEWTDEPKSPIMTTQVKKLVPGVYGRLNIQYCNEIKGGVSVQLSSTVGTYQGHLVTLTAQDLRAASKTFIEIADYLDEQ